MLDQKPAPGAPAAAAAQPAAPAATSSPAADITANLPMNVTVTSHIPMERVNAVQYSTVTVKNGRSKEVDVLPYTVTKIDFFCVKRPTDRKIPQGYLKCKFGSSESSSSVGGGGGYEAYEKKETGKKVETEKEKEKEKEKDREREKREEEMMMAYAKHRGGSTDSDYIPLDTDLVLIGRSLIKQVGDVHSVQFFNEHDEEVVLTIYVGYDTT